MKEVNILSDKELDALVERASGLKVKGWKTSTSNVYGKTPIISFIDETGNAVTIDADIAKIMLVDTINEPFYAVQLSSNIELPIILGMFCTDKLDSQELGKVIQEAQKIIMERLDRARM